MTGCSPGSTERRKLGNKAGLVEFAQRLGHDFTRLELLTEALTHPSVLSGERPRRRSRNPPRRGYDRLEFLGDRVLGLVVADLLWHRFADEPEGLLTRRLTQLVRRETLARVADGLGLGHHLILSRAEATAGAAANPGILADACEAVIAAIYLDAGFAAAAGFVRRLWQPLIDETPMPPRDPKSALQEWAQARGHPLPAYELVATTGPDHAPRFTVVVRVAGREAVTATAGSKHAAETEAAALALARLTTAE